MKRVHVLVEGQTEETFLRDVLGPYLESFGIYLRTVLVATKRVKAGRNFKGGVTSYGRFQKELRRLLGDSSAVAVTTMLDFYGLPPSFPGTGTAPVSASCYERVAHLEGALADDLKSPRFVPYLSLHEFEALLLVSPEEIGRAFSKPAAGPLSRALLSVGSPEEIDDGPDSHPAARIQRCEPVYKKRLHGPMIAARIGLSAIRRRCPHFDEWVQRLERLGQ